jgi:histidyl-tRNA synthetase
MAKTNPARGMRDFLPVDVRKREYAIRIIKQVYESYGYEPLETPAVENIETLMGKYGEEGNQLIFKILKRGEKLTELLAAETPRSAMRNPQSLSDLALRYDLTVPLARVVADRRNELPKFLKRYQIQPVWRADRPARGRFREFYQCDVDAIGSKSSVVEAELISAVGKILRKLGFSDFVIRLNHRRLLTGICAASGVHEDLYNDVLVTIDKIDKIGNDGVELELNGLGLSSECVGHLMRFLSTLRYQKTPLGSDNIEIEKKPVDNLAFNRETLDQIKNLLGEGHVNRDSDLLNLSEILDLTKYDKCSGNIHIDISLARGLSYYTGAIMELNVPDLAGSLGGGGRYDGLIGMFGKEQIPACGFSLGLERILVIMDERGMFPPEIAESRAADVMVTVWSEETIAESLKLADELRKQNLRVLVYPEADKLGKQIKYADSIKVPFVCVLGESEIAENKVTLKNMHSGEQETLQRTEITKRIQPNNG